MDTQTSLLIAAVSGVIAFGIYKKNKVEKAMLHESLAKGGGHVTHMDDTELLLSEETINGNRTGVSRIQMAKVLHSLERNLPTGDTIIQVYDYSALPEADGIQYIVDMMIFNSATTQSKTKRFKCSKNGTINEEYDISPITGDIIKYKSTDDIISDVLDTDSENAVTGAKFVRDKYTFIEKTDLPPEPLKPSTNNPADLSVYRQARALYEQQVKEIRQKNEFTRKRLAFVPTSNQTINADSIFPHEMPKTYGFSSVEEAPIDYSQLSYIIPLKDENFFNSIAQEKSAFNLQYN